LGKPDEQHLLMGKAVRLAAHLGCTREIFIGDCNEIARQWLEWSKLLQLDTVELPSFEALDSVRSNTPEPKMLSSVNKSGNAAVSCEEAIPEIRAMSITSDPDSREPLRSAFNEMDIKIFEYSGLDGFMEHILDLQPQILVLDMEDNGVRAVRLIQTLRASQLGRGIFILLLLPSGDVEHIAAIEAGADDFLTKSTGTKVLQARLRAAKRIVLLQQELEREREELQHFTAELAISNRSLQEAALTDALTGLPNRRYALERMQQEWAASLRNARSLACMVIDLDNFKQINDVYGHDVGDMTLRLVSEALRRVLRGQDVICRTGGDEFLVICPETSEEEALICGERLRKEIDRLTVDNEDDVLRLTISVGAAVRDETMSSANDLVKKADRAVFRAKRLGRNQVESESSVESDSKKTPPSSKRYQPTLSPK
jgi:diguanylate cyclase (GGDEF)-like protein